LKEILLKNDYPFPDEEYNLIYEITLKNYPNKDNKVTYKAFINAMRNLKREYIKYRTLLS
jgi:hypothetical protein